MHLQPRATHDGDFALSSTDHALLIVAVLSVFLFSIRVINSPLVFLPHLMLLLVVAVQILRRRLYIKTFILLALVFFFFHSSIAVLLDTTSVFLVVENFLRMVLYYVAFSSVLLGHQMAVMAAVILYLKISVIVAAIGLIALPSYVIGFWPAYDFSWFLNSWHHIIWNGHFGLPRAQSIFSEPAHAVYIMGPALFFALGRILGQHRDFLGLYGALTISAFLFMTNSTTFYAVAPFAFLLNMRISLKVCIIAAGLLLAFVLIAPDLSTSSEKIRLLWLMFEEDGRTVGVSGSSYTAYVGWAIASEIWKETLGLGGGLGAFEYSFERLMNTINVAKGNMGNYQSGGSLLVRVIAELGILGVAGFGLLLVTFVRGLLRFSGNLKSIHAAMAFSMLPFLVRMGTYEMFGMAFFLTAYIVNYRISSRRDKGQSLPLSSPHEPTFAGQPSTPTVSRVGHGSSG